MRPIVGLVGPSGSGKTTLIEAMVKRFPERVGIFKSLTTRPRRGPEDDVNYDFVSADEMRKLEADGRLIQISEYAGNLYANDRRHADELLSKKIGICALVEQGVRNLQNAGYNVIVVKIVPEGGPGHRDEAREQADAERAKNGLSADFEIVNSFASGGLDAAIEEMAGIIEMIG